jgi:hypothetical protein
VHPQYQTAIRQVILYLQQLTGISELKIASTTEILCTLTTFTFGFLESARETAVAEIPSKSPGPEPWDDQRSMKRSMTGEGPIILSGAILSGTWILASGSLVPHHPSNVVFPWRQFFRIFAVSSSGGGLFGRPMTRKS